jgi:hypothetical protein
VRGGSSSTARDARRLLDYLEALYRLIDLAEGLEEHEAAPKKVAIRLRAGASDEEVAGYLSEVRVGAMGLPADRPADDDAAKRIRAWYDSETGEYEDKTRDRWD